MPQPASSTTPDAAGAPDTVAAIAAANGWALDALQPQPATTSPPRDARRGSYVHHRGVVQGQGAGLVQRDRANGPQVFERFARLITTPNFDAAPIALILVTGTCDG